MHSWCTEAKNHFKILDENILKNPKIVDPINDEETLHKLYNLGRIEQTYSFDWDAYGRSKMHVRVFFW